VQCCSKKGVTGGSDAALAELARIKETKKRCMAETKESTDY
jgi:hypothetical protein